MADKSALGAIGMMLGAATLAVTLVAAVVVSRHVTGQLVIDETLRTSSLSATLR